MPPVECHESESLCTRYNTLSRGVYSNSESLLSTGSVVGIRSAAVSRHCRCGTKLASDNTDRLCSVCQQTRQRGSAPDVPAEFWQTDVMTAALASRDLGRVIRAYRCHPAGRVARSPASRPTRVTAHKADPGLRSSTLLRSSRRLPPHRPTRRRHTAAACVHPSPRPTRSTERRARSPGGNDRPRRH
jgi:hypothetical protein